MMRSIKRTILFIRRTNVKVPIPMAKEAIISWSR